MSSVVMVISPLKKKNNKKSKLIYFHLHGGRFKTVDERVMMFFSRNIQIISPSTSILQNLMNNLGEWKWINYDYIAFENLWSFISKIVEKYLKLSKTFRAVVTKFHFEILSQIIKIYLCHGEFYFSVTVKTF